MNGSGRGLSFRVMVYPRNALMLNNVWDERQHSSAPSAVPLATPAPLSNGAVAFAGYPQYWMLCSAG
jgi:hypothetical protein